MRRFLPIILIAFAALFILPQLFKGGGSKTLSSKDRAVMTRDAMLRIDRAQKASFAKTGKYTDSLADFVVADKVLANELTVPLTIDLSTSGNDRSYVVTISSDVLSVARARKGTEGRLEQLPDAEAQRLQVPGTADADHHDDGEVTSAPRWWELRRAQNLKPATYTCPLCGRRLASMSDHVLLFPEGDHAQRRHAHTECVAAGAGGRAGCRAARSGRRRSRGGAGCGGVPRPRGRSRTRQNTRRVPSGWCAASRSPVYFFSTAPSSASNAVASSSVSQR